MRTFETKQSVHGMSSIEAADMTVQECRLLRGIVTNQWSDSADYIAKVGASPFLQGYQEPSVRADGWCLVEFWSDDDAAIQRFVDHVNKRFAAAATRRAGYAAWTPREEEDPCIP